MEGTATSSSSSGTTPRKSDDKLGRLFSCWGHLTLKFRWLKVQRSGWKHYKSLMTGGNFDCKSLAAVAVVPKQPRPVGEFRYDPLSYSQNFDEGCWFDDEAGCAGRSFSLRFASMPSNPLPVDTSRSTTTILDWN